MIDTPIIGTKIIRLTTVDSTNNYTIELNRQTVMDEGVVVVASGQSNGRGQRESAWVTNQGENLTFSVLLHPMTKVMDQFSISVITSVALADALSELLQREIQIKWPNDLLVDGEKIAGVLIENSVQQNKISSSVVGIGLNVNQKMFPDFPRKATSMLQVSGQQFDLDSVLKVVLERMDHYYRNRAFSLKNTKVRYLDRLYLRNETATFRTNGKECSLVIEGVDTFGCLVARSSEGQLTFDFKSIEYLQ